MVLEKAWKKDSLIEKSKYEGVPKIGCNAVIFAILGVVESKYEVSIIPILCPVLQFMIHIYGMSAVLSFPYLLCHLSCWDTLS